MRQPILTFALLAVLLVATVAAMELTAGTEPSGQDEAVAERRALQQAAAALQASARERRSALLTLDSPAQQRLESAQERSAKHLGGLRARAPEDRSEVSSLLGLHSQLKERTERLLSAARAGASGQQLAAQLEREVQPLETALEGRLAHRLRTQEIEAAATQQAGSAQFRRARRFLLAVSVASVALAAICAFSWWKSLRRLKRQNKMLEQALGGLRTNQEFVQQVTSIVGHDLRSPLAALLATASHLLSRGDLSASQNRSMERIARSGARIRHLLQTLLDFTHSRHDGRLPLARRTSDLHRLTSRVVEAFQTLHPDHDIRHRCEGDAEAQLDTDRVTQIAWNLVDNAVRYSPPHSLIEVRSRAARRGVVLEVHNDGPPIPAALQETLFEPFQRGHQDEDTVRLSLGLGLYLVRKMVLAHGGEVQVTSTVAHGTTFTVWLPEGVDSAGSEVRPESSQALTTARQLPA